MGRPAQHTFSLPNNRVVGYGLTDRGGRWRVRFTGPDGKRWEEATGHEDKNKAIIRAAQIILKAYFPKQSKPTNTKWADALKELATTKELRPDSLRNYQTAVRVFRREVTDTKGPGEVTLQHCQRFQRKMLSRTVVKGEGPNRKVVTTSPATVATYLRSLRSLWAVHFKGLGFVTGNPWLEVPYPDVKVKKVAIPDEDHFANFVNWLDNRYPMWPLPGLFVRVKALAGCRTFDLCQVRSGTLNNGTLKITEADKTHRERTVPLPADLSDQLEAIKGKTYLWESFTEGAKKNRRGSRTKNRDAFTPEALKNAMQNIFREYREAFPDKVVKAHDFRKRAVALTTLATEGNVDESALALGLTPQTARRYSNDAEKSNQARELLAKMAGALDTANVAKPVTKSDR